MNSTDKWNKNTGVIKKKLKVKQFIRHAPRNGLKKHEKKLS